MKPQRNKYANRIAYLIATKRNTLRRLALKGASQSNRRRQSTLKGTKRKAHSHRSVPRTTRSGTGLKRMGRFTLPTRHKAQHSHFRSARRKSSRNNRSLGKLRRDDFPVRRIYIQCILLKIVLRALPTMTYHPHEMKMAWPMQIATVELLHRRPLQYRARVLASHPMGKVRLSGISPE